MTSPVSAPLSKSGGVRMPSDTHVPMHSQAASQFWSESLRTDAPAAPTASAHGLVRAVGQLVGVTIPGAERKKRAAGIVVSPKLGHIPFTPPDRRSPNASRSRSQARGADARQQRGSPQHKQRQQARQEHGQAPRQRSLHDMTAEELEQGLAQLDERFEMYKKMQW